MAIRDKHYIYGDHRLIEYKLLELEPKINFVRMTLTEIFQNAKLGSEKRLFMYDLFIIDSFNLKVKL
jgi:hypothetical protein